MLWYTEPATQLNIFLLYKHVFFHLVKIHALFAYLYNRLCELRGSIGLVFFVRGACAAPRIFCKNCVWRNCFERTVLVDSGRRTACCFMVSFRGISAVSGQGNRYQNGNWKILKCVWTPVLAEKTETPAVEADSDCAFIRPAVEIRIEYIKKWLLCYRRVNLSVFALSKSESVFCLFRNAVTALRCCLIF